MGFSKQEYWSGLPFSSPGDIPKPGIEPKSPELQVDSLPSEPPGSPSCPSKVFYNCFVQIRFNLHNRLYHVKSYKDPATPFFLFALHIVLISYRYWSGSGWGGCVWCWHLTCSFSCISYKPKVRGKAQTGFKLHIFGKSIWLVTLCSSYYMGFPGGSGSKEFACSVGDLGSIPGSGRFPGERNGNLPWYFWLENPMDGGTWKARVYGVTKSQIRLSNFTFLLHNVKRNITSGSTPATNLPC